MREACQRRLCRKLLFNSELCDYHSVMMTKKGEAREWSGKKRGGVVFLLGTPGGDLPHENGDTYHCPP